MNREGKLIGVYNFTQQKFIAKSSLRNQAYKDYFYGKDGSAEKALEYSEGIVARIIKDILGIHLAPSKGTKEHQMLLLFTVLQVARTEYAEESANEGIDKFLKQSFLRSYEEKDSIRFRVANVSHASIRNASLMSPITFDLGCKLLLNKAKMKFITSDNPAVLYNQFLEFKRPFFNNTGFVTKGLEIFLPISSELCLVFYDEDVYKIGDRKAYVIPIDDMNDIESINAIQFVNCNQNLYFDESFDGHYFERFSNKFLRFRRTSKVEVEEYSHVTDPNRVLVQAQPVEVRCGLSLSFIKVLKKAKKFQIDYQKALIPRSDKLVEMAKTLEEFSKIH